MSEIKVELCIENYESAKIAKELGYDSVEINSALSLGGLTPTYGVVRKIAENINIKKYCMVRNRPAGFNYSDAEFNEMLFELEWILKENIDGIVFGFLTNDFKIDKEKTSIFVNKIHKAGKIAIFHRAFDNVNDPFYAIEDLIELKIDRLLTSGLKHSALDNTDLLKKLIEVYSNKIEIIIGSGVNENNVVELIDKTNAKLVHSSCKKDHEDITTNNNVSYSISKETGNKFISVDKDKAERFINVIRSYK